jgi:predicted TPR repeat methyltransferase
MLTSGDVLCDRRADYARMLADAGDFAAAADLLQQALDHVPDWSAGWFMRGDYCEKAGDIPSAIAAFETVLQLSPDDMFGAGLKLAHLGAGSQSGTSASRYVEHLFNDFADRFEESLVGKLNYHVPEKLRHLLERTRPHRQHVSHVADLGCGTGLCAEAFAGVFTTMEGCDLSAKMLAKARAKNLYSELFIANLAQTPATSGLFSAARARHRADLVLAADVLIYLGDLHSMILNVVDLISPNGLFAFSVEEGGLDHGFKLQSSLRYAHSLRYISDLCLQHGFTLLATERTTLRLDGGIPVEGCLIVCTKRADAAPMIHSGIGSSA